MKTISIALCADDYGQHEGIDDAVCALLSQLRLSAVSCMSTAPRWPTSAPRLKEFQNTADFGLHFNLTESFGTEMSCYSLGSIIIQAYLRQLNSKEIAAQFHQQCDAFEQHLKQAPAFIDGHQHVHQLPVIRDAMLEVIQKRYGDKLPWVRNTVSGSIKAGEKALVLRILGGAKLKTQLRRAEIASNKGFSGVYDFRAVDYAAMFEEWLQEIQNDGISGTLVMCHPSTTFVSNDPIGKARTKEYEFFNSNSFPQLLEQYQINLQRLSSILNYAQN